MDENKSHAFCPFRPNAADIERISHDVADIGTIQNDLVEAHPKLTFRDRVAHQFQIAGGRVSLHVADKLPAELSGVGIFQPSKTYTGIGRVSTGLGIPHIENIPDFLGLMMAFQTQQGQRVDFLAINHAAAPADNHLDFMDILRATAVSAGSDIPLLGERDHYDALKFVAEQFGFAEALKDRMGWIKAGKTLAHITQQTLKTARSDTAYQRYWTGVVEMSGKGGKFTFIPAVDENHFVGLHPGEHHLSEEWQARQRLGDVEFLLYWIPYINERDTPTDLLTHSWVEEHRIPVGSVCFTQADAADSTTQLWSILASEMGANPGNWVADKDNSVTEPSTEFTLARKIAYGISQKGRDALAPSLYQSIFQTGLISDELAKELSLRSAAKSKAGHLALI